MTFWTKQKEVLDFRSEKGDLQIVEEAGIAPGRQIPAIRLRDNGTPQVSRQQAPA